MQKDLKLRNKKCICGSGKKFKNCHLDVYQKAEFVIINHSNYIKLRLHEIANQMKTDMRLAGDTYTTTEVKDSRQNVKIYEINGYRALQIDYKDLSLDISTVANAERIAQFKPSDIEVTVLYKKPEIKGEENAGNGNSEPAEATA